MTIARLMGDRQVESFRSLAESILALPGGVRLVAVDGYGGAGKSTFAARLAAALGGAAVVHTDDFATGEPGRGVVAAAGARGDRAALGRSDRALSALGLGGRSGWPSGMRWSRCRRW